ncbi:MAG TPA: beta-propeller fold lactonase family protein [Ignavibacteria bacterium]|nr:beta-propeller fold lactonase family protein [Ignavibacteria bacterium]HMR39204.1 beta-propeller fold lactonase family protein [Ignavibacteria bacterium]
MKKFCKRSGSIFISLCVILIFILLPLVFQSCEQDFSQTPDNVTGFPTEIEAIFNEPLNSSNITCASPSCHASGNNTNGMDLVNWNNAMNGSVNGTMIIPYNGYWSHFISYINSDTNFAPVSVDSLFPEYHKISQDKVQTIYNWINDGAKSKDGQIAFTDVAVSEKGFITNQAADLVAVIKPDTKQVIRLVPVGGIGNSLNSPHYVKLSPDHKYFYVSLISAGYIQKFDANTHTKLNDMMAGQSPAHIEISADGLSGYVTNFASSGVSTTTKFNTSTMTVSDVFAGEPRMTGPHGMALTNDGNTLFITSEIGEYIFKINTNNFYQSDSTYIKEPIDPTVPPSGNGTGNFRPYQILLSPDESLLFISCRGSSEVRIFNASDLSFVKKIFLGNNAFPLLMNFTNDGKYIFVCNRNNNTVSVINRLTQEIQTTISDVGIQPHGVDFTADGQYAYIACETLSGFDGHHPTVGSKKVGVTRIIRISDFSLLDNRIEMGSFPAGIEIVK